MAHILVLNRLAPEVARYDEYLDHEAHRVSYLTTPQSVRTVAPVAERYGYEMRVLDLRDEDAVAAAAHEIARTVAPIDRLVALSEIDTLCAAHLREAFQISGQAVPEAMLVRDKALMKRRVAETGTPIARFASCADRTAIDELVREAGWPLVLKPRQGWASRGVETVRDQRELDEALGRVECDLCILEEYVDAPLYHADGLAIEGEVAFIKLSRYVNTPFSFKRGVPLGGWMVDDPELLESGTRLVQTVCEQLSINGAFHLEAFRPDDGGAWTFSEIGARAGGGPIVNMLSHAFGVDLHRSYAAIQAGLPGRERVNGTAEAGADVVAGYLCWPEPSQRPCRVVAAPSMAERVPEIWSETLPPAGTLLEGTRHYLDIAVEFVFEAPTSERLRAAIDRTLAEFHLECEPVPAA